MVNLDVFLAPLDGDNPSGTELRNDPRFQAIERLIEPAARESRTETPGAVPNPVAAVDWADVLSEAADLARSGRDLRLLVIVARALANEGGIDRDKGYLGYAGFTRGLELIAGNLAAFWDTIHPELRDTPTPREAGLRRINALMQLENDGNGLLGDLQMNAVIDARGMGTITGADLAAGTLSDNDVLREGPSGLGQKEQAQVLEAHAARRGRVEAATRAMAAENPDTFAALSHSRTAARAALDALAAAVNERLGLGPGEALRFVELARFLDRVGATLSAAAAHAAAETGQPDPAPQNAIPPDGQAAATTAPPSTRGSINGAQVNSREDVERALDLIIAFYERTEPSSPIPHLARRLRRMVPMDFMELMEEVAPGGVKDFRAMAGVPENGKK
ncbi:ImpA family type VI secretion system protein [Rhodovulum euryhalinum]|uniref:Type VI secretion system protein ImpA n=1 Tax=Rhodovulum euryhalinum TaxID=35805 RepID=A0A4R2KUZ4_9RHOB|nr:type VI secretion system ImpA family N-terminal domain-containing protein [Rhodovulum euryhalinum]TCO70535.1 type VI secretion system protein ImpA [Rhodovulum euryhalinum]